MKGSPPEWALLIDESGRYWQHLASAERQPYVAGAPQRFPGKAIFGIASHDLISCPQWVNSKDPEIISQLVSVEIESLGLHRNAGPGCTKDWTSLKSNGTRSLIQAVAVPWTLSELDQHTGDFVSFCPQYSLFPPPPDSVVFWKEDRKLVVGYTHDNRWIHVQTLDLREQVSHAVREANRTMLELSARNIMAPASQVVVWTPSEGRLQQALETEFEIPVYFTSFPSRVQATSWKFEPHQISLSRKARQNRRRLFWLTLTGVFLLMVLLAAAAFDLHVLKRVNRELESRIAESRDEATQIETSIDRWVALEPALDQSRSPLELLHHVTQLLPEKSFRLTLFEVQDFRTILLRGEASSMASALQFKGALERAPGLQDYVWEIPPPRSTEDLTEFFATGTYRY